MCVQCQILIISKPLNVSPYFKIFDQYRGSVEYESQNRENRASHIGVHYLLSNSAQHYLI